MIFILKISTMTAKPKSQIYLNYTIYLRIFTSKFVILVNIHMQHENNS